MTRCETPKRSTGLRQDALPLLPMPRGAYKEVIEGRARRFGKPAANSSSSRD